MAKKKNIFKETFKGDGVLVTTPYIPTIQGYTVHSAYFKENGCDLIDGKECSYLVMKVYMEENKDGK